MRKYALEELIKILWSGYILKIQFAKKKINKSYSLCKVTHAEVWRQ